MVNAHGDSSNGDSSHLKNAVIVSTKKTIVSEPWLLEFAFVGRETNHFLFIRRPLLTRGTKAADLEYRLLFNNNRSCFQLSAICC